MNIRNAAVIGAGTMGSQIAAHLANAGIPSLLMDIVPAAPAPEEAGRGLTLDSPQGRNRGTQALFDRAKKLSPAPLFTPETAALVRVGNVEDHLPEIAGADWVIEAVLERMDLKRELHKKIAGLAGPGALVTTNTSGLPIDAITEGLPRDFRRRFFATHFFNPPRYMRLLELIPNTDTDPSLLRAFAAFAESALGKGIVVGKDTPGFVANRVGCFDMQRVLWLTLEEGLTIDEADALTGPAIGRPKSATYRLGDIVGIDLMAQMGRNLEGLLRGEEELRMFRQPEFIGELVKRGWWGEKSSQGFYKRVKTAQGREIHTLDYKTLEYRPQQKPRFASLDAAAKVADPAARIRSLCAAADKAGQFAWKHLSGTLCYAASRIPEIADDVATVDQAMRWGYNWDLGPFEIWDALGVKETAARLEKEGRPVPPLVRDLLAAGLSRFYETRGPKLFSFVPAQRGLAELLESPKAIHLPRLRQAGRVVKGGTGASLVDLGDGVACLEVHAKMNVLGADQLRLLTESVEEVRRNFLGLVIGNQGPHFSAGADLLALAGQIQNKAWDEIDRSIRAFQNQTSGLRRFEKPVVAACHGYTLGGGCEVQMGCDHVVLAAETYLGLPEAGVGLIPAAHGTKEMLIRCTEDIPRAEDADYFSGVKFAWETVGLAKVSASGPEALRHRYVRVGESTLVLNPAWLIGEAKAKVLQLAASGYRPKPERTGIPAIGQSGLSRLQWVLQQMRRAGQISEHDEKVATKLGFVLCGGDLSWTHFVTEQYLLDLEREAFLSLCGESKTLERIQHTLKTGKPLRN